MTPKFILFIILQNFYPYIVCFRVLFSLLFLFLLFLFLSFPYSREWYPHGVCSEFKTGNTNRAFKFFNVISRRVPIIFSESVSHFIKGSLRLYVALFHFFSLFFFGGHGTKPQIDSVTSRYCAVSKSHPLSFTTSFPPCSACDFVCNTMPPVFLFT